MLRSTSRSEAETFFGGMRAIFATMFWMSSTSTTARPSALGLQPAVRAGLVDHVDGLVGQMAVVDVLGRQLRRGAQRLVGVLDAVMLLEAAS